jgi:GAF domain-containing protein
MSSERTAPPAFSAGLDVEARFTAVLAWTGLLTSSIGLVPTVIGLGTGEGRYIGIIANAILVVVMSVLLVLLQRGKTQLVATGLMVSLTLAAFTPPPIGLLLGLLALLATAAFANRVAFLLINLLILGLWSGQAIAFAFATRGVFDYGIYDFTIPLFSLTAVSLTSRYFITLTRQTSDQARRGAELLQASAEIGQAASRLLDARDLLTQTAGMIAARFNYYNVRIYLLNDAGTELILNADSANTRIGRSNLRQQPLNPQLGIGAAVLRARPTIVRAGEPNFTREDWELHTRSQLVLPLFNRERVIGVVDIQSRDDDAFDPVDVQAVQIVADVLSSTLGNARLFEAQRQTAEENQQLYEAAQANLREIQRLNQELTGQAWEQYTRAGEKGVTLEQNSVSLAADWTEGLLRASEAGQPVTQANGALVAVPLLLRGEVIGAIEVQPPDGSTPADTVEMVEAVAQRLAVSLENARLYQETSAAAAYEQRINDIAARYQEVTTVDELLRITVTELSHELGAAHGAIRLSRARPEGERDAG